MSEICQWLLMRWEDRIESQLLLRGEACGCCCGDGSTADDDGSPADGIMRWLRSDGYASNKGCRLSGQQRLLVLRWEAQAAVLRWRLKQPCCHVARVKQPGFHVAQVQQLVISCEENHDRLNHGRLDVHSSSLRSTEKS